MVRKLRPLAGSSVKRSSKVNGDSPSWVPGWSWISAVRGARVTVSVAGLVRDSSWPASSVKVTRTLMVLSLSRDVRT